MQLVAEGEVHGFRSALTIVFEVCVQEMDLIQCYRIISKVLLIITCNYKKEDNGVKI